MEKIPYRGWYILPTAVPTTDGQWTAGCDLARLADALAAQAKAHAGTPMVGRTWLQHATPVTLGMKIDL